MAWRVAPGLARAALLLLADAAVPLALRLLGAAPRLGLDVGLGGRRLRGGGGDAPAEVRERRAGRGRRGRLPGQVEGHVAQSRHGAELECEAREDRAAALARGAGHRHLCGRWMAWGVCNLISTRTATASPTISARGAGSSSCSSRTCVGPVGGGGGRRASPLRRAQKAASSAAVRGRHAS